MTWWQILIATAIFGLFQHGFDWLLGRKHCCYGFHCIFAFAVGLLVYKSFVAGAK